MALMATPVAVEKRTWGQAAWMLRFPACEAPVNRVWPSPSSPAYGRHWKARAGSHPTSWRRSWEVQLVGGLFLVLCLRTSTEWREVQRNLAWRIWWPPSKVTQRPVKRHCTADPCIQHCDSAGQHNYTQENSPLLARCPSRDADRNHWHMTTVTTLWRMVAPETEQEVSSGRQ